MITGAILVQLDELLLGKTTAIHAYIVCFLIWIRRVISRDNFEQTFLSQRLILLIDNYCLKIDDLNITNVNDRDVLLQSVAAFTGTVEDYIKTGSLTQSSLITSFANEEDSENARCEPEMEVLKSNEDDYEEKTTKFPAFTELLPTIGEEDEINEGEEKINPVPLTTISSGENNDDVNQVVKLEEKGRVYNLPVLDCMHINFLRKGKFLWMEKDEKEIPNCLHPTSY